MKRAIEAEPLFQPLKRSCFAWSENNSMQHCQQVSVLLYNIIIFIYIIHIYVSYTYFTVYMCMCFDASLVTYPVCLCVCVCLFLYTGGDLNLNTHRLMGTCVTVGT